jgi:phosphotriesterase-related protein
MAQVETVRGPVDTAALGATLMHEHVFVLTTEITANWPERSWGGDREARIKEAVAKLEELRGRGIATIVDLTVLGLGRSIPDVAEVNAQVDLNIVVATGLYTFDELPTFFLSRRPRPTPTGTGTDVMVDMFVEDIEQGIGGTGVKAGVLKCCTESQGVTPGIDRVLRAVARAHRWTGVPISTHTNASFRTGLDQQRVFAEEGVDLSRVVIGHSGDSTDLDYLRELMDRGSMIGMDRFGIQMGFMPGFEERVDTIVRLCGLGYADRMVLSHDTNCHMDSHLTLHDRFPDWVFTHISDAVLPALRQRGVTDAQIEQMMVINPRRVFERQGGY